MLGTTELILIFGVAALLFGANKLPELARSLGSSLGEFQKAKIQAENELKDIKKDGKEGK